MGESLRCLMRVVDGGSLRGKDSLIEVARTRPADSGELGSLSGRKYDPISSIAIGFA